MGDKCKLSCAELNALCFRHLKIFSCLGSKSVVYLESGNPQDLL